MSPLRTRLEEARKLLAKADPAAMTPHMWDRWEEIGRAVDHVERGSDRYTEARAMEMIDRWMGLLSPKPDHTVHDGDWALQYQRLRESL